MSEVDGNMFKIRINYKSGNSVEGWFDEFSIKHAGGELQSVSWKESAGVKQIIFLGMSEIESIVQLEYKSKESN